MADKAAYFPRSPVRLRLVKALITNFLTFLADGLSEVAISTNSKLDIKLICDLSIDTELVSYYD